jgi:hypothetical protein
LLNVSLDPVVVERQFDAGELLCPEEGCGGVLRRWWWARPRIIEVGLSGRGASRVQVRPRRGRCRRCGRTQVLLPAGLFSRRADAGAVIGLALMLAAVGLGFRRSAVLLGRPESTVRDWVQAARLVTGVAGVLFAAVAVTVGPDAAGVRPRKVGPGLVGVIGAAGWMAACLADRGRQSVMPWWVAAAAVCRCRFLQASWWDEGLQHESVLPVVVAGPSGWLTPAGAAGRSPPGP